MRKRDRALDGLADLTATLLLVALSTSSLEVVVVDMRLIVALVRSASGGTVVSEHSLRVMS